METVIKSTGCGITIHTGYIKEHKTFATVFEYPNGDMVVVDQFNSPLAILETHDYWCRFTGIVNKPLNIAAKKNFYPTTLKAV